MDDRPAEARSLTDIARHLEAVRQQAGAGNAGMPVLGLIKFSGGRAWVAPLGTDAGDSPAWIEVKL